MDQVIEFYFTGEGINPRSVRVGEIARVLEAIEDVLTAVVLAKHPQLAKDDLLISLINVNDGSLGLQFSTELPEVVVPAFRDIAEAIESGQPLSLPKECYKYFEQLLQFVRGHEVQVDLILVGNGSQVLATITPDFRIPKTTFINGETIIYGEIVRVGGAEPKVEVKTLTGKTLYCPFNRELASQLGALLYQMVGLAGIAQWDSQTYEITDFRVLGITEYRRTSITKAFSELSTLAGEYYADVTDVTGYISALRKE